MTSDLAYKISVFFVFLLVVFGVIGVISHIQTQTRASLVGDAGLVLKANPEKIVQYTEYDQFGRPLPEPSEGTNNNLIKYLYATEVEVPPTIYEGVKEDISKRTPSAQLFLKSVEPINGKEVKETYVGKFYSNITFNERGGKWYQVESATTTKSSFLLQTKPTLLAKAKQLLGQPAIADTYFSGAGDGHIRRDNDSSWSAAHDAAAGETANYTSTTASVEVSQSLFGSTYDLSRVFLPFDTSAVTGDPTSASLNLYVTATSSGFGSGSVNIVETTQPSSSQLAIADYDLVGVTTGSTAKNISIAGGDFPTLGYSVFTLNSTGLTWIKKSGQASSCGGGTGVTCLGFREAAHDIADAGPGSGEAPTVTISTSEEASTSQDPYLEVTFSVTVPALKINGGTLKINGGTIKVR